MKFKIYTLGCKVNSCDSGIIAEILKNAGFEECCGDENAAINIINTCAVTAESERKSRQLIRKVRNLNPSSFVAACGCWSRVAVNINDVENEANVIIAHKKAEDTAAEIVREASLFFGLEQNVSEEGCIVSGTITEHKTRAALKIQDGCNRFCTYCIIPYARASLYSVSLEKVVSDVNELVKAGFKEVVLTGIHIASYNDEGKKLIDVIEAVASQTSIQRIRLGSLEPKLITEDFVRRLAEIKSFCHHFHLSLQSGSSTVLKRMNRRYTAEEYLSHVELIRRYMPDAVFTTDIIVGFPGETEEEFIETVEFVKKVRFANVHLFPYSRREGTPAANYPNQLSRKKKHERLKLLERVCCEVACGVLGDFVGKDLEVLTEYVNEKGLLEGYSANYLRVEAPSCGRGENEIHSAKIERTDGNMLVGEFND